MTQIEALQQQLRDLAQRVSTLEAWTTCTNQTLNAFRDGCIAMAQVGQELEQRVKALEDSRERLWTPGGRA